MPKLHFLGGGRFPISAAPLQIADNFFGGSLTQADLLLLPVLIHPELLPVVDCHQLVAGFSLQNFEYSEKSIVCGSQPLAVPYQSRTFHYELWLAFLLTK